MTFKRRVISVSFTLGTGSFGDKGNTVTVAGLRVQAQIDKVVGPGMGTLNMRIHGMTPDQMNQISALNQAAETIKRNTVTVQAGDDGDILATVFQGQILVGQQNLNSMPDTSMLIAGAAGHIASVQTLAPISYPSGASAAIIMANLAQQAGMQFENSGVQVQLPKSYFIGSPREQMKACAEAGQFNWMIDDGGNAQGAGQTLAIWPKNGTRTGQIPLISPETGMIGYPDYSTSLNGLTISTLFNPNIRVGGLVQIKSGLQVANGTFRTFDISHTLESETPGGRWMTRFGASTL